MLRHYDTRFKVCYGDGKIEVEHLIDVASGKILDTPRGLGRIGALQQVLPCYPDTTVASETVTLFPRPGRSVYGKPC
jgi:hypothetical protein